MMKLAFVAVCLVVGAIAGKAADVTTPGHEVFRATLGAEPRLVCALRPDRTENLPGVQRLAYDIPWNLVGADAAIS